MFLVGLSWGGIQYEWASVEVLAPIAVGVAALGAFVAQQRWKKTRGGGLLPMRIFYCRSAVAAFWCAMANGFLVS